MSACGLNIIARLTAINSRLIEAGALARTAIACAEAGSEREAMRIALDLDVLLREAVTLHGAAALIGRMPRSER